MKKRVYRRWENGDVGYCHGYKGIIERRIHSIYPLYLKGISYEWYFTENGFWDEDELSPILSFLPTEQSMPFDEVEDWEQLPEKYAVNPENLEEARIICNYFEKVTGIPDIAVIPPANFYHYPLVKRGFQSYFRLREVAEGYTEISFEDWQRLVQPSESDGEMFSQELIKPVNEICDYLRTLSDPEEAMEDICKRLMNEVYEIYVDQIAEISEDIDRVNDMKTRRDELEKKRLLLRNRI
jgi:hypothetical protein